MEPSYRSDHRIIGGAAAGSLVVLGIEGAVAESYLQTPEGQREKARAQEEGSALYRQTKELVLRPGVFGGLLGLCMCRLREPRCILLTSSFLSQCRHSWWSRLPQLRALERPRLGSPLCPRHLSWHRGTLYWRRVRSSWVNSGAYYSRITYRFIAEQYRENEYPTRRNY